MSRTVPETERTPSPSLRVGIDVGSTTVKAVAIDPATSEVLFSRYRRHHARQTSSVAHLLEEIREALPGATMRCAVTGSGGTTVAEALGAPYIQEVVANSVALQHRHASARTAIELGGQDAKIVFLSPDERTGQPTVSDMRMNGSCAGGTGAFLDEIAALLNVPVEEFDALAACGTSVHVVSGRCGVYAKTDIQPLLNRGVPKEDLALSTFHAVAKQTIGGLAQGLDIEAPVVFEGGPLTFNPTLVRVFAERLGLDDGDVVVPKHPETFVALGAALAVGGPLAENAPALELDRAASVLAILDDDAARADDAAAAFFADADERRAFELRHAAADGRRHEPRRGEAVRAYLGIDSGSTTTKFALIGEDGGLLDWFYASNEGEPLAVTRDALLALRDRYRRAGAGLDIVAAGTTGYGEMLFAEAYRADCHVVETSAHARAARTCQPDATFVLDIGGQDMKAIWMDDGVITNIVVNEACSSGCGSFLEGFAATLGIPVEGIAEAAFSSASPASLGSRCTVFMNSGIVTEQRSGKTPADIMAGLCRSIVENVFTKVIRVSNLDGLGERIVVQGGTFANDAVLRAFEAYIGRPVVRAPHPGLMGALGAALLTKERVEAEPGGTAAHRTSFIGLDALETLSCTQEQDVPCPFCSNRCNRTLARFSSGTVLVTGNRCPKGEVVGDPADPAVRQKAKRAAEERNGVPNLFDEREALLFRDYPHARLAPENGTVIGLPRVLSLWDNAPFWRTLFRSLGFTVRLSRPSSRALYESGLSSVTSDTVCFPAKLVHGHVRDLAERGVDRIFMPMVTVVEPEGTADTSESMCAVVKGYPMVVRSSDDPQSRWAVPFDTPLFHWYTNRDRERQLAAYLNETFGIPADQVKLAIAAGDAAQAAFKSELERRGAEVLESVERSGGYAVVLASRPYQNDPLVNHGLPGLFVEYGVPVLTADAVPGVRDVDLSNSRLDIVNNYHARMLASALIAARSEHLEYAQVVSFGCGHDAYLSDEIARLMKEAGGKAPLVLKVDESDAEGPLRIRVRSFVETVDLRRRKAIRAGSEANAGARPAPGAAEARSLPAPRSLPDPYPAKYRERDRREKVVLVPNTSHAFCRLMTAAFRKQGLRAEPLDIGRDDAIRLGKRYVHNDICFPAQIVIGEALAALESGRYDADEVAIGMGKYIGDCRLTHYSALLRKALDDAGYERVPILTNDDADDHDLHPGFRLSVASAVRIAFALPMVDVLEELLRKMRPYELEPGSSDRAFEAALDRVVEGLERDGVGGAKRGFKQAVRIMGRVRYDRSRPRPRVLIVGEYLLNFHPGANHDIEAYLERSGFEVVEARMTDVIRKTYFYQHAQVREYHVDRPLPKRAWFAVADNVFEVAHDACDRIAAAHPLYERAVRMPELVRESDDIVHHTFDAGEGVLIPGEILHHAAHGCRAFVILQPFGCLPNHVVGRGIAKSLKRRYPNVQILPLDYDPDVSFANVENRLQMLVMNARAQAAEPNAIDPNEATNTIGAIAPSPSRPKEQPWQDRRSNQENPTYGNASATPAGNC
ncbi:activase [Gordonibacter sp. 28C]|uniref:acyl-CoA dehydratase activase n=1 Tax=Gordonibacter sp. 28C TaxID=2078569 RepID=UPI000DF7FB8C|nr:acyl-CoA dehydratase activase [Gordonibacter sp. 28C]RDB63890.1 activase [Gordonibacter sp. 28C]